MIDAGASGPADGHARSGTIDEATAKAVQALAAEVRALREEVAVLRHEREAPHVDGGGEAASASEHRHAAIDRRSLLTRAGVVGAGVVAGGAAIASGATPAAAANGDPLTLGSGANSATAATTMSSTAAGLRVTSTSQSADHALAASRTNTSTSQPALTASNDGFGSAIYATVSNPAANSTPVIHGVHAGPGGVLYAERNDLTGGGRPTIYAVDIGTRGAIEAFSGGVALRGGGELAPLRLDPLTPLVPTAAEPHATGEFRVDDEGRVVVCTAGGNPGTWRRLVAAAPGYDNTAAGYAGSINLMASPFRLFDSRPSTGAPRGGGGKLQPSTNVTVEVTGVAPSGGGASVPAGAVGVLCTITLTGTEGAGGFLKAFPAGTAVPDTSVVNWFGAGQNLATTTIVRLSGNGRITLRAGSNRTDAIVDVVGFVM